MTNGPLDLISWRPDLLNESKCYPGLRLYLVLTPPMPLFDRHLILQQPLRDPNITGTDEGVATTHTWAIPGGAQEHGILVGPLAGVERFLAVATALGSYLPPDLRPTKPFHDLEGPQPARYDGRIASDSAAHTAGYWITYLFERLRGTDALVVSTFEGMTAVRTRSDPFLASVLTIDPALPHPGGERTAEAGEQVVPSYIFAQLPDGRYFIRFAKHQDTLEDYVGLKLIHYLLRHPTRHSNKGHKLLALNRDLYADETKPGQIEYVSDESGPGLSEGYTLAEYKDSKELSKRDADKLKAERNRLRQLAKEARANGDEEQAEDFDRQAKQIHNYLREYEYKLSPELETIRKKLGKNLSRAYDRLEAIGFTELVTHLRKHLTYELGTYKYTEDPSIQWSFRPSLPER